MKTNDIAEFLDKGMTEVLLIKLELDSLRHIFACANSEGTISGSALAGFGFTLQGYVERLEEANLQFDKALRMLSRN